MRTTILNLDYSVITIVNWQKGITLLLLGKVQPIEFWEKPIMSAGGEYFYVPKVVTVKKYIKLKQRFTPTRRNIFLRDSYTCQYCGAIEGECYGVMDTKMTIDHVLPKSRGGKETWENLVSACIKCNNLKGNRTPAEADMELRRVPSKPNNYMG